MLFKTLNLKLVSNISIYTYTFVDDIVSFSSNTNIV